ncbi:MAG: hypothetical protein IAF94_27010 [Pirellulaceae bacterium]|nr:hypothetical protein [Pirellulaceae bacterium]
MTNCDFESIESADAAGFRRVRCRRCGFTSPRPTKSPLDRCFRNCDLMLPDEFVPAPVGGELSGLLAELGIEANASCACAARSAKMDAWGIEGCKAHRETILAWLAEGYDTAGFGQKVNAGFLSIGSGLIFKLSAEGLFPGLLNEAIRRAEAKETK